MNVAFLVFRRPDLTRRVFEAIRAARPERLFLVVDGPRPDVPDDLERVGVVKKIVDQVDWPCAVERNYAETNLGCRKRVSSGLDWVFSQVEEAIILEDDCLPDPTFFRFCEELLIRYRDDPRVMMVSGDSFPCGRGRGAASYRFSAYAHVWGWATWRRAWQVRDMQMEKWPGLRGSEWLRSFCADRREADHWTEQYDRVHRGEIDTWDYAWQFALWVHRGLCAVPAVNLVENIGFGGEGTNWQGAAAGPWRVAAEPIAFPLVHPATVARDGWADRRLFDRLIHPRESAEHALAAVIRLCFHRLWKLMRMAGRLVWGSPPPGNGRG